MYDSPMMIDDGSRMCSIALADLLTVGVFNSDAMARLESVRRHDRLERHTRATASAEGATN